jgi:glycosyltransferase involved in cell wall biosynthesis
VDPPDVSLVLPTYNERDNVEQLLPVVLDVLAARPHEVIVVDDGSPDGTADAVRDFIAQGLPVRLVSRPRREGIGAALRAGYAACRGRVIASMDADQSFDPHDLPRLLARLDAGADLVVGTRHALGGSYDAPTLKTRTKRLLSGAGNRLLRSVTGIPLTDYSGNFRVFRREVWDAIETAESTNALLFEVILEAYVKGFVVAEIPVAFRERRFGVSKLHISREAPRFLRRFWRLVRRHRDDIRRRRAR